MQRQQETWLSAGYKMSSSNERLEGDAAGRPIANTPTESCLLLAKGGLRDLVDGLMRPSVWGRLGWLEVKRRYRRTVIGPFWSVISLAVFVTTIGSVGVALWNQNPFQYLPYLTAGMLAWLMISNTITEACTLFVAGSNLYRQARFDYSLLVYALIWRNLLVFLHQLLVYALMVLALAPHIIGPTIILLVPGLLLLMINGVWISLLLGLLCVRFRDVQQMVISLTQIAMLTTPLFWPIGQVRGTVRLMFAHLNPLYHCIEVVRAPLLGAVPTSGSYVALIAIAIVGWATTYFAFELFRKRIAYWS
jgi:ABC-type polysaccharide/polyol phosphate export permease